MLNLYNTLSRKKEEFKPIKKGILKSKQVGLYTCGPTVYNYAHIGNLRTYVFEDILKRVLEYNNYNVKHVENITDVGHLTDDADDGEDKMEKATKREGKTAWKIAEFYTNKFKENLADLNITAPNNWCKAPDHIPEQITLVQKLIDKGVTYETSDGIYFDTTKIDDYGKLANLKNQKLQTGERVAMGEKKNPHDFALWKFSPAGEKRQMEWDAFGKKGFPGWHIECSAMSMKYLGEQFDIHCGGIDHIPVHHTNEIAQSETATGKTPWVKHWLHGEFLVINEITCESCGKTYNPKRIHTTAIQSINGEGRSETDMARCPKCGFMNHTKMAKSGDNFITLDTLKEKGINPLAYRYFLLQTHYRKQLNFSWEALEAAQTGLKRLYTEVLKLKTTDHRSPITDDQLSMINDQFLNEINNDLNTPQAIALIWEALKTNQIDYSTLLEFDKILGLGLADIKEEEKTEILDEVKKLLDQRKQAREDKDYKKSDELRDEIKKLGWEVKDTGEGQEVNKL